MGYQGTEAVKIGFTVPQPFPPKEGHAAAQVCTHKLNSMSYLEGSNATDRDPLKYMGPNHIRTATTCVMQHGGVAYAGLKLKSDPLHIAFQSEQQGLLDALMSPYRS